jgi:hypothetical protein
MEPCAQVWVDMFLRMHMYLHDPLMGTLITDQKFIKKHYCPPPPPPSAPPPPRSFINVTLRTYL